MHSWNEEAEAASKGDSGRAESYVCSRIRGDGGDAGRRRPASSGRSARPAGLADGVP